ncbi:MAG: aminoacyl-histidine dipeptidase [Paludibacteraceae bacterium]|nr:aminoacyl-histidine dipeptidase [Paludibacteraceae bacterium]
MNYTIEQLVQKPFWKHFYSISQIPRPSGHMQAITAYIEEFGKALQLETIRDGANNILIRKSASAGYEDCRSIILQSHLDMVPQKNESIQHDFYTDAIKWKIQDNWLMADNTTLGADNGIGVATMLSILENQELSHSAIEALFTVDEENGMNGVFGLGADLLKGDILINLDSEDENEIIIGCAGAVRVQCDFFYEKEAVPEGDKAFKVSIKGLLGGHSGIDIHLQRANANKLLFHFLKTLVADFEARLSWTKGGNVINAIPREAEAVITVPSDAEEDLYLVCQEFASIYEQEYEGVESNLQCIIEPVDLPNGVLPQPIQDDVINAVIGAPNGVYRFVPQIGSVETSSNLGVIDTTDTAVSVHLLVRSNLDSMKGEVRSMIESIFSLAGAKITLSGNYDGWAPKSHSTIVSLVDEQYEHFYHREAQIKTIHAGLECGIIGSKYPHLDMVSFGPTIKYPHSPNEQVDIESAERFYRFLTLVLSQASN